MHGNPIFEPARDLVRRLHCPHCWQGFAPSDALFVSEDPRLLGDPVAGADEPLRFLPSRFDLTGAAIDPEGARCTRLACPRCRQEFPRAMLEVPASIVSVVGAPGAGKSHLLASAAWSLRREGVRLGVEMTDAEPRLNARLHEAENLLFASADPQRAVRLAKTETAGGGGYRAVRLDGRDETVPVPFIFAVRSHGLQRAERLLVLYDNAGEHFMPGADDAMRPVTRHLGRSEGVVFVLDPTQDPGFRRAAGLPEGNAVTSRQDLVLAEMASRIRHHRGRRTDEACDVPLVIAMAKADLWAKAAGVSLHEEPYEGGGISAARLRAAHQACMALAQRGSPEFVAALRAAFGRVLMVPCSALGAAGEMDGVRPSQIEPHWAAAPFVAAFEWLPGGRLEGLQP